MTIERKGRNIIIKNASEIVTPIGFSARSGDKNILRFAQD